MLEVPSSSPNGWYKIYIEFVKCEYQLKKITMMMSKRMLMELVKQINQDDWASGHYLPQITSYADNLSFVQHECLPNFQKNA